MSVSIDPSVCAICKCTAHISQREDNLATYAYDERGDNFQTHNAMNKLE